MYHYSKKIIVVALLQLLCFKVLAQQNLFNIPSGDITPHKKMFYQHQLNFYSEYFESKSHFVYGLGKGWDMGFNFVNTAFSLKNGQLFRFKDQPVSERPMQTIGAFTLQKSFKVNHNLHLNIGTQLGANINRYAKNMKFAHFTYGVGLWEIFNHWKLTFGGYYSNDIMLGRGNQAGVLLGYDIPIIPKKFYLMGDFISGNHVNGVSIFGIMIPANKRVQFCLGALVPNYNNKQGQYGVVFELNLLGFDYW